MAGQCRCIPLGQHLVYLPAVQIIVAWYTKGCSRKKILRGMDGNGFLSAEWGFLELSVSGEWRRIMNKYALG